jgi:uncharacterized membrane protein
MMPFLAVVEVVGQVADAAGIAVIVLGMVLATIGFLKEQLSRTVGLASFKRYRQGIGRSILLGLEILVAADIIRTVALEPSFRSLGVLALIIVIRTFLSWSLELELEGRWPWQQDKEPEHLPRVSPHQQGTLTSQLERG